MLTEEFLRYLKYERAYSQKTIEAYSNDLKALSLYLSSLNRDGDRNNFNARYVAH